MILTNMITPVGYMIVGLLLFVTLLYFLFSRTVLSVDFDTEIENKNKQHPEPADPQLVGFMVEALKSYNVSRNKSSVYDFLFNNYRYIRMDFNSYIKNPLYVVPNREQLFKEVWEAYSKSP